MPEHIKYLSDDVPICVAPDRLGTEYVVNTKEGQACGYCLTHLIRHNEEAYNQEQESGSILGESLPRPEGNFLKGLLWGVGFSLVLWYLLALVAWVVFFRG